MKKIVLPVPTSFWWIVLHFFVAGFSAVSFVGFAHIVICGASAYDLQPSGWFFVKGIFSTIYLIYLVISWKRFWKLNL